VRSLRAAALLLLLLSPVLSCGFLLGNSRSDDDPPAVVDSGTDAPIAADVCAGDACDGKPAPDAGVCSESVDLCRDLSTGQEYPADAYTLFTIPARATASAPFTLYVVTKDKELKDAGYRVDNHCGGGAGIEPCFSAGRNCAGWKVFSLPSASFPLDKPGPVVGEHTLGLWIPNPTPPCSPGDPDVTLSFTIE
jgi:hypothetical protein